MSSGDINLETGDPGADDAPAARRRRRRQERAAESVPQQGPTENEIRVQLERALDGLHRNRIAAGDEEMAAALGEDGAPMVDGFVNLTKAAPVTRMPMVIGLNVTIVLLAFGRVGGILARRWVDRRARIRAERNQQEPEVHDEYPHPMQPLE